MSFLRTLFAVTLLTPFTLFAQRSGFSAVSQDPAPNKAFPASMETFQLPSHGALLNALVYLAAGQGPHPTVILLHGFPGNEKNLDLAQALRRDGFNVLYFDYRGSWGSRGAFSFTHSIEDAQAALAYLRNPANAQLFRTDPNSLILAGHSMGGMIAAYVAAHDLPVPAETQPAALRAVILISAADMAGRAIHPHDATVDTDLQREIDKKVLTGLASALDAEGLAPLAGCTPESLAQNLIDHPEYALRAQAARLTRTPLLDITSDDGLAPANEALVSAIQSDGSADTAGQSPDARVVGDRPAGSHPVTLVHIPTDHSYSDHRIQLTETILDFLAHH